MSVSRARSIRRRFALGALLLAACRDEPVRGSITLELAPLAGEEGEPGCDQPSRLLFEVAACVTLRVCRSDGSACADLSAPDGDHGAAVERLLVPLDRTGRFGFDARLRPGLYDVEVTAYDASGAAVAFGRRSSVDLPRERARVRLYRYAASSCAGPRDQDGTSRTPLPRAFHVAVPLPDGDVLLLGGVTGENVPATGLMGGAPVQAAIELYDTDSERFVTLPGRLPRVLFAAVPLPSPARGPYRVRIVGGFEYDPAAPALRFDLQQVASHPRSPVMPGPSPVGGGPARTVDLVYDPLRRTVRFEAADAPGIPAAAANVSSIFSGSPQRAAVLLGIGDPGAAVGPRPMLVGTSFWIDATGMAGAPLRLRAGRFGASVSRIGTAGSLALVWGGNVAATSLVQAQSEAGELVEHGASATVAVRAGEDGLPLPTAWHSATELPEGRVLVAGGLEMQCSGGTGCTQPILTRFVSGGLTVLGHDSTRGVVTGMSIDPGPYRSSAFHTATRLLEVGGEVVLAGGLVEDGAMLPGASDQLVTVNVEATGGAVRALLPTGGLRYARWGHAAAPLPGGRLLVSGGMAYATADRLSLRVLDVAEVVFPATAPLERVDCSAREGGTGIVDASVDSAADGSTGPDF
ncbi:MAG: hypothetical protein RMK74_14830 [Myxococcales bacterium]|nr:hypothetical protein [Myxococcales bacterium]